MLYGVAVKNMNPINGKYTLTEWIENDPTLNYLINEATYDPKKFDHQFNLKLNAFRVAYNQWLNYIFK